MAAARVVYRVLEDLDERDLLDLATNHARKYHVPVAGMVGRARHADVVRARHTFWKVLREEHGFSLPVIGRIFGVGHSTVLSALRALADTMPAPAPTSEEA